MKMDAKDELIKARVKLQHDNPFFSYLVMNLKLIEDKKVTQTCAVDSRGNLYYNPDFIDKLNQTQIKTLCCHEVLHIALHHLTRRGKRDALLFNISADLVINNTLRQNNFEFSGELEKGVIPQNNVFTFPNSKLTIADIDKKIAEEIYNELNLPKNKKILQNTFGFDKHIYQDGEKEEINEEEKREIEKEWNKRLSEASTYARMQGKEPKGMERYIDKLLNPKLNWKELLYRYITAEMPFDYSYNSPSKRSQVLRVYMPRTKKEMIDITIAIDTSGSIQKEELIEFLSEVVGIGKSFANIRLNVFFMDTKVNGHYIVNNGSVEDILNFRIEGGGGTDFREVYNYIEKEIPTTKLLIFFTDLYAEFPKNEERKTIWVVTKNGDKKDAPFGETLRLE